MTPHERLLLPENLNYAWIKAKRLYKSYDGYVDNGELAEFELNLYKKLKDIQRKFKRGTWRTKTLLALPRPKKLDNDVPIDRQYFHVAVEDQVAWIAITNALGPELDKHMPTWSYGNRIYRPAWYEDTEERKSKLEIGPYRHASGHLYRKFKHSWPLYRRHVALTAKAMVRVLPEDLDRLEEADRLAAIAGNKEGLQYLRSGFWTRDNDNNGSTELYCGAIDLKSFFPSLKISAVLDGLAKAEGISQRMHHLMKGMLKFRVDLSGMPPDTVKQVDPALDSGTVSGVPTGLFVAGFLANAAMLPLDLEVDRRINRNRSIAHFKYVDDHIILAYSFEALCDWIKWYRSSLQYFGTGAEINKEKCDPDSLGKWLFLRDSDLSEKTIPTNGSRENSEDIQNIAIQDCRLDGANPTKLLTKTLGHISAIAAANIDVLDDEDLEDRLKMLEWLLLANIPEQEIRPDTRAAFAAGQISKIAPVLVQEAQNLVEASRSLARLQNIAPKPGIASEEQIEKHKLAVKLHRAQLAQLMLEHDQRETRHLRHCFTLLLQAFREYPGKARLFFRVHDFCRDTGFHGLKYIAKWFEDIREQGYYTWANYYTGLSLHILARSVLICIRRMHEEGVLRSEREAALHHLEDVSTLDGAGYIVKKENEAWFHTLGRIQFGIALRSVAEILRHKEERTSLATRLDNLASRYVPVSFSESGEMWNDETNRVPGVWAHYVESIISVEDQPSDTWDRFESLFSFRIESEIHCVRRYPERLSDRAWHCMLDALYTVPETDSGLLLEVIADSEERLSDALSSRKLAFMRAARSLRTLPGNWITLTEWTQFLSKKVSPFDPRRSEWTALEIIRQLLTPIVEDLVVGQEGLDRLHPKNVLVPKEWISSYEYAYDQVGVSWEEWRKYSKTTQVNLRNSSTSVFDYRYYAQTRGAPELNDWEKRLVSVGRLLLGLFRLNHDALRMWNIRGNELVFALPRTRWFRSLVISSSSLLLIEGCLGARSAETRAITINPSLYGWRDGVLPNDTSFDPPSLVGPNELLDAITDAQEVLKENQLAVSMNQPRQLVPFRLSDFAIGPQQEIEGGD